MHCYYHSLWPRVTPSLHILSVPFTPRAQSQTLSYLCLEFVSTGSCQLQIDLVQWFSAVPTDLSSKPLSSIWHVTKHLLLLACHSWVLPLSSAHPSEPARLPVMRRDLQKTLPLLWEAQQRLGSVWRRWKSFYLLTSAAKGLKKHARRSWESPWDPMQILPRPSVGTPQPTKTEPSSSFNWGRRTRVIEEMIDWKEFSHPRGAI